jgi:hypothetical protein
MSTTVKAILLWPSFYFLTDSGPKKLKKSPKFEKSRVLGQIGQIFKMKQLKPYEQKKI